MAFQGISTGSGPNIGDGDTLFSGAIKINSNFSEVYNALGDGTTISSTVEPDNVNTGIVTATDVDVNGKAEVDNVRIDGNEIDTTSGNLTLDSSGGTVTVDDNLNVSGVSSFTGVSTFSSLVEVVDDEGLYIKTETNNPSTGARIRFSDKTSSTGAGPFSQYGQIKYKHSDDTVVSGYADGFVISGTEVTTALKLEGDFFVDNVGISTNLTVDGNTTLGSANTDTITATGRFDSDLVPSTDNARSLGAVGLEWRNLFIDNVANIDTLNVNNTLLVTGNTNLNGSVALGNEDTDNVTINGKVNSNIVPLVDDTYDLGTSTLEWRNLYINGTAKVDTLTVDESATVTGTLNANGDVNLGNATTDTITATGGFDSALVPSVDDTYDLGTSSIQWRNLYIDGTARVDTLQVDLNATVAGSLSVNGGVNLGNDTTDTITATGRFDSDLVPSTDNARSLGATGLEWRNLFIDNVAKIDTLNVDGNASVDGTTNLNGPVVLGDELTDGTTVSGNLTVNGSSSLKQLDVVSDDGLYIKSVTNSAAEGAQIRFSDKTSTTAFSQFGQIKYRHANDAIESGYSDGFLISGSESTVVKVDGDIVATNIKPTGNITVAGTLNANGAVNLGNANTDTITATGRFDSHLIPSADNTYDLGSASTPFGRWRNLWIQGTADVEFLQVDQNATVTGTLNAQGGYYIGISSAGQSITTGPIKTLNFIGAGNTFAYNASTDTIDISIAGGGGGISENNAPTINQVTLSEANTSGARFTGKSFNVNVDMFADGIPISQKGVKGKITGAFQTYDESIITANSIGGNQNQGALWSNSRPPSWESALFQNIYAPATTSNAYFARLVTKPTTKGGGSGAGYYMISDSTVYVNTGSSTQYVGVHNVFYTPDLAAQTPPGLLYNVTADPVGFGNFAPGFYVNNICIEGDIVWCESDHVNYLTSGRQFTYRPAAGIAWRDSSGNQARTNQSAYYYGAQVTSDGECAYFTGVTGGNLLCGFYYPSGDSWTNTGGFSNTLVSSVTIYSHATCYHKPSNKLVVIYQTDSNVYVKSYPIDSTSQDNSTRLGTPTEDLQFTGAPSSNVSFSPSIPASESSAINIEQLTYCGADGTFLIYNGVPYRYDSSINKFTSIPAPINLTTSLPEMRIHGSGNGFIYMTVKTASNAYYLYESNDQGDSWTTNINNGYNDSTNDRIFPYIGVGLGEIIWTRGTYMYSLQNAYTDNAIAYAYLFETLRQTLTIGSGEVSKYSEGDRISLKSDVNNNDYRGIVDGVFTSTIDIKSNEPYPISGDSVVNLDTPISTLEGERFIVLNGAGDISQLSLTDPGFVTRTNGTEFSVKFPTQFTNGVAPDTDIPVGAFLQVTVEATNQSGTDEAFSNNVQPS